jgi:protein-S-isoprenylcysteine O-methyltransferase Ste14
VKVINRSGDAYHRGQRVHCLLDPGDSRLHPLPFSGSPAYAIIFWSTYAFWVVLETIGSIVKRSSDHSRARDRGSSRLLMLLMWLALALGFTLSFALPQAAIMWKRTSVFFVGITVMLGGLAFRFYAMRVLGRSFTYDVAVQAGQTIVAAGPYRYIRHPSYTGALITLVGLGLALGNWAALLIILACMGIAYAYRITVEEAALVAVLGEPYRQYMRHTRRLVPFLF